ncbi:hypothetical protein [Tateyamaria sp.]|uniref:hypothetical protein n=1 Tax=Tateyamaria sp. TaxID=1929288 RepID=UPI00329E0F44
MSMRSNLRTLLLATASPLIIVGQGAWAQDLVTLPAGANTEPSSGVVADAGTGFTITIDGGDTPTANDTPAAQENQPSLVREQDIALAEADLFVTFDGLNVRRRLNLAILNENPAVRGDQLRVQSQLNYPAFVERAELRLFELAPNGQVRLISVVPIAPNGTATITVPEQDDLAIVHRVYDARGRFDETAPRPLFRGPDSIAIDNDTDLAIEEGSSALLRQRIPIFGGAVTVRGDNVPPGARVQTLGEDIQPDPSGSFVLQRILPPGDQPVAVEVTGAGPDSYVERNITIPRNEWFYTATADLTYGWRSGNPTTASGAPLPDTYDFGRLAGYAKGRTSNGWTITASADTGEEELSDLFRGFDEKDTQDTLLRSARENAYPTFGDDSSIEEGAPTDGKFFLKAERDGSHLLWGNFNASVTGSTYLRNERRLYGLQGVYNSPEQTERGEARVSVEAYGASPDRLPGRETFLGTGGSVYFLQRQDISVGSETLTLQLRDVDTGRLVETRVLTDGRDYDVNYLQGVIILAEPLTSRTGSETIVSRPGGEYDVFLVANYEFTPVASDLDGFSYGGRAETWVTDDLRIGVTTIVEQTDIADQTAVGADVLYKIGENSQVSLEYAETEGPGFGSSTSSNGGLVITSVDSAGVADGSGRGIDLAVDLDLYDLGFQTPGRVTAYFQDRTAGFSTLDYQTSVDEQLWGFEVDLEASERVALSFSYDSFRDSSGKRVKEAEAVLSYSPSQRSRWDFGVTHLDQITPGGAADETGKRTDVGVRYTRTANENLEWYIFGQASVDQSGDLEDNDRAGVGIKYRFAPNWTFDGEVSGGSTGAAGEAFLTYQADEFDQTYIGYRLEPGREFSGVDLVGQDRGTLVIGGQRRVSDRFDIFAENQFDAFGRHRSLTSVYGVQYRATEQLTFSGGFEFGRVNDAGNDFDRDALSFGVRYSDGDRLTAAAKIEYRLDEGEIAGIDRDQRSIFLTGDARYKIDESQRLLFSAEYADTDTDNSSILSGTYADVTFGYAYRPINNDKLNLLFSYRYLYDLIGQELDGTDARGALQRSHVVSIDGIYDLNKNWTLGGKLGGRFSDTAVDANSSFEGNDAWLAVVNARYHLTHKWDILMEARHLQANQADFSETGFLAAGYRHVGNNLKIGVGYNFGQFSDDLTDITLDDQGPFINLIAKF